MSYNGFYRAKILSYNAQNRTAQIHINGLTDGASDGITATFAYAIGEDDRDTEIKIDVGGSQDVFVFFEGGDTACPVIAFYASHGVGAMVDTRQIRQQNINILTEQVLKLASEQKIEIHAKNIEIHGNVKHIGDWDTQGMITASDDVIAGLISLINHYHLNLSKDYGITSTGK